MRQPKKAAKAKLKSRPPAKDARPQKQRFIEAAREHGADETGEALERAFAKAVPPRPKKS